MSTIDDIDELLKNIPEEDLTHGFDEIQWDDLINSDKLIIESLPVSNLLYNDSDTVTNIQEIVKLSTVNKISSFTISHKLIDIAQQMTILVSPSLNQRVRYENECEKTLRYVTVPNNGTITIGIPDLRSILPSNDVIWMRITRTTIDYRDDKLIFYHPYPMWIKNKHAKVHHGSMFIPITEKDMENGFVKIYYLTMIRLKQESLIKITTLAIYSPTELDFTNLYSIDGNTPKQIRDEYKLRQSILNFQLVYVDQHNVAFLTNCVCQTETIRETEAGEQ